MRRPTQKLNNAARMMRQQTFSIINYTSGDNWRKQQAAQARLGMSWSRPTNVYESFNFKFTIAMIATMIAQFVDAHQ
jgi:hypothetical protein